MQVSVAYGKTGMNISLDDDWDVTVVNPKSVPGLPNPIGTIQQSLRTPIHSRPLRDLVKPSDKIGIIFNDITRATPNQILVQAILDELPEIPHTNITLFNALGTHRLNTEAELREMLGDTIVEGFRIVQNNAFDQSTQNYLGKNRFGHEIWINKEIIECDVKILTGFIEPSDIAGFSGGPKAIMPGMAGLETILGNHGMDNISHPKATWGITQGNPLWDEIHETAHRVGSSFILNVTLNDAKQITGVFGGELDAAHTAGCEFVRQSAMVPVNEPFDIVITSNSGYPLDQNLYQCIKGMGAAAQIVKNGGIILIVAECRDGIPDHGLYGQLLKEAGSPSAILKLLQQPGFHKLDQWQVQIQAQIQSKAQVYVYSDFLTEEQITTALLKPALSVEKNLREFVEQCGSNAKICILPEGPQTIAYIR